MTRCRRCGRELTNPESIDRGYGSICWAKTILREPMPNRKALTLEEFANESRRIVEESG